MKTGFENLGGSGWRKLQGEILEAFQDIKEAYRKDEE